MNGKERILKLLNGEKTDRTPWIPYTGIQVGSIVDSDATELYQNGKNLLEGLLEANKLYHPDGQPVIFDLQIEAEILGCDLVWAEKAPPTVSSHPFMSDKNIPETLPERGDGRLPMIVKTMKELKEKVGETTALYGLICGPLTLASHLRGTAIFMDMFDDEDYVKKLIEYSIKVAKRMSEIYIEAGMDVIASVDPLVSQISPDTFAQYLTEPYQDLFKYISSLGVKNSFFVCGDATKNMEKMCETGTDCISIDENIDIVSAKLITDKYNIAISGNLPLTSVMLLGNQQDNRKATLELMDKLGNDKFILAPGCDIPYDVPKDNLIAIAQTVAHPEAAREMTANYEKAKVDIKVELPDYKNLAKPLLEIMTLDSAQCAACGYMKSAVMEMVDVFGDKIDIVEYKATEIENLVRLEKMNVTNLPSFLINGELKYSSIIPKRDELIALIETYL